MSVYPVKYFLNGKEVSPERLHDKKLKPDSVAYGCKVIHNGITINPGEKVFAPWNGVYVFAPVDLDPFTTHWIDNKYYDEKTYNSLNTKLGKIFYR